MTLMESFRSAFDSVRNNKMRSFLTMLGIIIGIASVIAIVAIGQGGKSFITGEFDSIGSNLLTVSVSAKRNETIENRDYLTLEDANNLASKIPQIRAAVPEIEDYGIASIDGKNTSVNIAGMTEDYNLVEHLTIIEGRAISKRDVESAKQVIIIDDITAKKLFNRTVGITGNRIKIVSNDAISELTIIGVFKNPNGNLAAMFGDNMPGTGIFPITICDRVIGNHKIRTAYVLLDDIKNSKVVAPEIVHFLERTHRNTDKYSAVELSKQLDTINNVLNMFTLVIGAIAGISLVVGGIGVMNIMLVSVTERTREIGIRKSLGAKNRDILMQFLTESIILCLIGGAIGMSLGFGLASAVGNLIKLDTGVSPYIVIVAFGFSSAVGIFFGLYPANKAAKLDPIEALRYE